MKLINVLNNENDFYHFITPIKQNWPLEKLPSIETILDILNRVGRLWLKEGIFYDRASKVVRQDQQNELSIFSSLFRYGDLKQRLEKELENLESLNKFSKDGYGDAKYYAPLGILLHITAGNTLLGAVDSLIMGLITRNINILKISDKNYKIMELFLESLELTDEKNELSGLFHFVRFKGDNLVIQECFKKSVHSIIAWGGEDMAIAWKSKLPFHVKFHLHGPKIGFHIITKEFFAKNKNLMKNILLDVATYEQHACANSQNLFYEEGIDENDLLFHLSSSEKQINERTELTNNEYVELQKDYFDGLYNEFKTGRPIYRTDKVQIVFGDSVLKPSALNRSLICRKFSSHKDLIRMLKHFGPYLQSVGLGAENFEKDRYRLLLSHIGVTRFSYPGEMLMSRPGAPHDGSFNLLDLVRICIQEKPFLDESFVHHLNVPAYDKYKGMDFGKIPLCNGDEIASYANTQKHDFIDQDLFNHGEVYGTGGTTGKPKFCFYTDSEFKLVGKLLGKSYLKLGLKENSKVGNLFMAGNLWSSFNAVQEALKFCNVIQFPFGGSIDPDIFCKTVHSFGIECLFGLPGLLVKLSEKSKGIKIKQIFYAGEILSESMQKQLKQNWEVEEFFSAGYASVDVGPIGFQDKTCNGTEHILFSDLIHLEVINEEAVVTSKVRQAMPVIRYQTGDRIKIIETNSDQIRFKLLGRVDKKINLWSSRMTELEIIKCLKKQIGSDEFQVQIKESESGEILNILCFKTLDLDDFTNELLKNEKDLRETHHFDYVRSRVFQTQVSEFIVNERTGKRSATVDLRKY